VRAKREVDFRSHLYAYWLRPECALWDSIAANRLGPLLQGKKDLMEVGIGNGNFSFLMLGGKFKPQFDWFLSASTKGFWDQADIYDFDAAVSMDSIIENLPNTRIRLGVDHKRNLLNQAARLGFVDEVLEHDCNRPLPATGFSTVYSNMLYWLTDPMAVIKAIGRSLPPNGELITVFPNSDFYRHCQSYRRDEPIWQLLNRGRASSIMWHMDLPEFEDAIKKDSNFDVALAERYLCPTTLKIWDIGLRPLSVPLIKMANALTPEKRLEIKHEWCETVEKFAEPLLAAELEVGSRHGGFNLVRLVRK
jgi:SAM-dependent methyltransferase